MLLWGASWMLLAGTFAAAAVASTSTVYVANLSSDSVTAIEPATATSGEEIKVGTSPVGIAITPNGTSAYVTNALSDSVTPIEPVQRHGRHERPSWQLATNRPGREIKVGVDPSGIAITPDGTSAYVTNQGSDSVTPIEVQTNTPGKEIKVGTAPTGVAITPANTTIASEPSGVSGAQEGTGLQGVTGTAVAAGVSGGTGPAGVAEPGEPGATGPQGVTGATAD